MDEVCELDKKQLEEFLEKLRNQSREEETRLSLPDDAIGTEEAVQTKEEEVLDPDPDRGLESDKEEKKEASQGKNLRGERRYF